jgi:hypothetical protein
LKAKKYFIKVSEVESFANWLSNHDVELSHSASLYIHNGDLIPHNEVYVFLASRFSNIYSVNWLGDISNVHSIPIGLENQSYIQNGVVSDFARQKIKPWNDREIDLLIAFSVSTNLEERKLAFDSGIKCKNVLIQNTFVSPREYRNLVSNSKFVLSPPGNGPDCHRTWEAIYLGAIPIVHSKYWNFPDLSLNVGIVKSWDDLDLAMDSGLTPLNNPANYLRDKHLGI